MPAQYTDITILLDRSGSMDILKIPMESAIDEFLLAHKKVPSTRVSLIQFDNNNPQDEVYIDRAVGDVPRTVIDPRGTTPLLDALCFAIDNTGRRLDQKPESSRPDQVLFVIITDGWRTPVTTSRASTSSAAPSTRPTHASGSSSTSARIRTRFTKRP